MAEGVDEALVPYFKVIYAGQEHYAGNGSDWSEVKRIVGEQIQAVVDAGASHST